MNRSTNQQSDIATINERLAKAYYLNARYYPILLLVAGIGIIAIYLLTQFGIFGDPAPQLINIGGSTIFFAIAESPILTFARRKNGIAANFLATVVVGIFAILLNYFWEGIVLITILLTLLTPFSAILTGMPRKYFLALFFLIALLVAGILSANANAPIERLQNDTPAAIATIVFFSATSLLLLTDSVVLQNRRFRSVQSLLLTSFIIIVIIPTLMSAALTAVGSYTNNQAQTYNSLEAITSLKEAQIETLLADSRKDAEKVLSDPRFSTNVLFLLTDAELDPTFQQGYKRLVRWRLEDAMATEEEKYKEIMVLDTRGNVMISTDQKTEGTNFERQPFFQQGRLIAHAGFADVLSFGSENLVIAAPILDPNNRDVHGVLVFRSNAVSIQEIMENTPGFNDAETYLVDLRFRPVTTTRTPTNIVQTKATLLATRINVTGGRSIYPGYTGQQVLGYYEWFEPLQLAIVAEVPLSTVISSSVRALAGSSLLALILIAIAIAAVVVSARTISDPITNLAQTTQSFAAGEFSARAIVEREDEIGALAESYNQMAAQLQDMIGKLEQRVADRTLELESQSLRLRVAAEIARDSATAQNLNELLDQAAQLICNRFGFYHAGIFLLDLNKQYAVLVASPTEAGKKMIENNHKLRVGETGIVGRVAASGEPRVTLNTGADAVYFNNPYLPNTRSEMALPLKVGNNVIGVIDVQSDQEQAFNEDDVAIMQVMADQLATAIERTRLLQEVQKNLKELEGAYGRITSESWKKLASSNLIGNIGYHFDNIRLESVTEMPDLANTAFKTGMMASSNANGSGVFTEHMIALPIKLRGQTIGVVNLKLKEDYDHSTMQVIEAATERLASALESARLYEEARLRADREEAISRVTTAISASTEYEQILQATVREIGNILSDTEVAIQIVEDPASSKRADQREQ